MTIRLSRRSLLASGVLSLGMANLGRSAQTAAPKASFRYSLNMGTILGLKLGLAEQVDVAIKAGYHGIEPWIRDIEAYAKAGGNLADIRKKLADSGVAVEGGIGFANWIVDDDAARARGLETARHDMDLLVRIGGTRIAAPPAGATDKSLDLSTVARRYRALCDIGEQIGVVPQVEIWGASRTLSRLGEAMFVAIESGYAKAAVLPDVYHIHRGGGTYEGIRLCTAQAIPVIHMNDYPADPPREKLRDEHRVYPGDGIAPLDNILRDLAVVNPNCVLSLELFNREYWKNDALTIARTGLEKMKAAVAKAGL